MNPLPAPAAILLVALGVSLLGSLAAPAAASGVWAGAGIGAAVQLLTVARAAPRRRLRGHILGMLARFGTFALVALVAVPALGLPVAATLLSLVTVFVSTTVLEPILPHPDPVTRR